MHCVIVSILSPYKVEIHTRNGAARVQFADLRETEAGEIRRQMKAAREFRADNSELWLHAVPEPTGVEVNCDVCDATETIVGEISERTLTDDGWYIGPRITLCPEHSDNDD
jgi:hypothetical protein